MTEPSIKEAVEELDVHNRPAIVQLGDDGVPFFCKHALTQENGWLKTVGFDDSTVVYPPHAIEWVELLNTERTELGKKKITDDGVQKLLEKEGSIEVV